MDYISLAQVASVCVRDFMADVLPLARETAGATVSALHLHLRLLLLLARPLVFLAVHLYHLLSPLVAVLLRHLYQLFTLQPAHVLAIEALCLLFLLLLVLLERRFAVIARTRAFHRRTSSAVWRRYRRFRSHLKSKSRLAANLLPHALFLVALLVFRSTVAKHLTAFTTGPGMVLLACVHPAVRTLLLLYRIDVSDSRPVPPTPSRSYRPRLFFTPAAFRSASNPSPTTASTLRSPDDPLPVEDLTPDSDSSAHPRLLYRNRRQRRAGNNNSNINDDDSDDDLGYTPINNNNNNTNNATPASRARRRSVAASSSSSSAVVARRSSDPRARAATVAAAIEASQPAANTTTSTAPDLASAASTPSSSSSSSSSGLSPPASPQSSSSSSSRFLASVRERCAASPRPPLHARTAEMTVLRFWVVFGALWVARSLAWFFCPRFLERVLAMVDTQLFYVFVWAQLPLTRGADVLYDAGVAVLRRRWQRMAPRSSSRDGDDNNGAKLNALVRLLVAVRVVEERRATKMLAVVEESGLALIGVVFLILPRWATFVGTLLVGFLVPCYLTMNVLEARARDEEVALARHNWLAYWGVFSLVETMFAAGAEIIGWMPLWYHTKMICILWLQLPYYRGSVVVLDWFMARLGVALSSVRQQTVTPMKRKRA